MKMFLFRHGEQKYPYNERGEKMISLSDAPLSELGMQQIRQLGEILINKGHVLEAVYSSPILRADHSSRILACVMSIPNRKTIYALREIDPNSAEGHLHREVEARGADIYAHPFSRYQETLDHLIRRSRAALRFILRDANKRRFTSVGIVGHGDPLCALHWCFQNKGTTDSYYAMTRDFYPQKGEAYLRIFDNELRFRVAGGTITTDAAQKTIESFRSVAKEIG